MSGICGHFQLDGARVATTDLRTMTAMLEQRGPERTGRWQEGSTGLGHTLLATTPELQFERQPFEHAETGCVITADVRLDNRDELAAALTLRKPPESTGDAELILEAYLEWGDECPNRLLGDFAFVIWDPRHQRLFCARDHFGMRPLYYHHTTAERFVFASDARAILVLPQVPYKINEGRVADFLVAELEWYDYTSTFYEGVYRLPPGHRAVVTSDAIKVAEYWHPQPGPELGNLSDDEYREGFVEVFSKAVDARLRAPRGTVGSMLSGGMDSGSVTAFAKEQLNARGEGPLPTFSGARRLGDGIECSETSAIQAASKMPSIRPNLIYPDELEDIFEPLSSGFEEPFDGVFTILKALFLRAHDLDLRVLLDGGGGDVVLNECSYIVRLIRQGNLKLAIHEIMAENKYRGGQPVIPSFFRYSRAALLPHALKQPFRAYRYLRQYKRYVDASLISPEFAQRVQIEDRIEHMRNIFQTEPAREYSQEYCNVIRPNMTGGKERYARIAAATGMEARDPFMDKRVIQYCSRLPGRFRLRDGWPKAILRDVTAGALPDEVRWTRRKPHLGWLFAEAINKQAMNRGELKIAILQEHLKSYVNLAALTDAWQNSRDGEYAGAINNAFILSIWLRETSRRPVVPEQLFM